MTNDQAIGYEEASRRNKAQAMGLKQKWDLKNLPTILTTRDVSEILRVSPLTIKRMGQKIPYTTANRRGDRRYQSSDVLAYIESLHIK